MLKKSDTKVYCLFYFCKKSTIFSLLYPAPCAINDRFQKNFTLTPPSTQLPACFRVFEVKGEKYDENTNIRNMYTIKCN